MNMLLFEIARSLNELKLGLQVRPSSLFFVLFGRLANVFLFLCSGCPQHL
jgi:hypothetical protein